MSTDETPLTPQRERIDQIDSEILDLLAERNEIVREVTGKKISNRLPVYLPEREERKTESFREQAAERGLDPDWAEDFLRMIMSASRASQSVTRFPMATEKARHILIVGAEGGMGSLYSRIAEQSGHTVYRIDRHNWHELEEIAPKVELAIVSVPIRVTEDVIRRLAPRLNRDTVLADFTSNKSGPIGVMLETHPGPVVGLHPMHGPGVQNLSKQLMVVCGAREPEAADWFLAQCRLWGMQIVKAEADKHDQVMHLVQGLRHFVALLHGSFMKTGGLDPRGMLDYSSPIYRAELMMTGRIFAQDAELYADIVFASRERRELLTRFFEHHRRLATLVAENDRQGFIEEFESVTDFFGSFATQALEESGYLINRLADRFA